MTSLIVLKGMGDKSKSNKGPKIQYLIAVLKEEGRSYSQITEIFDGLITVILL